MSTSSRARSSPSSPRSRKRADAPEVLDALRRIVRYLRLADREVEQRCRLSAAQLFVLQSLIDAPAASLAELAERSMTDQSSVSTVVARLVARNLVAKKASRADRRRTELRITPAGQRILARAPRLPQSRIIEAVAAMPAGRRDELVRALGGFASAIGADEVAPRMFFEDEPPRRRRRA